MHVDEESASEKDRTEPQNVPNFTGTFWRFGFFQRLPWLPILAMVMTVL
jgi:hypothetical protein